MENFLIEVNRATYCQTLDALARSLTRSFARYFWPVRSLTPSLPERASVYTSLDTRLRLN